MLFLDRTRRVHAGCSDTRSPEETQSTGEETSSDADAVQTFGESKRRRLVWLVYSRYLFLVTRVLVPTFPIERPKWPPRSKVITLLGNRKRAVKVPARTAPFASRRSCASSRLTSLRTSSGRASPPGWTIIHAPGKRSMRAS